MKGPKEVTKSRSFSGDGWGCRRLLRIKAYNLMLIPLDECGFFKELRTTKLTHLAAHLSRAEDLVAHGDFIALRTHSSSSR